MTNITVTNINRPPALTGSPNWNKNVIYVAAGSNLHYDLQGTDPDKTECADDTVTTSYSLMSSATSPTFNDVNGAGTFDWNPQLTDVGQHTLKFRATDGSGSFVEKEITVYVHQPSFTWNVNENSLLSFIDAMNSTNSSDSLSIQAQSLPSGASMPTANGNTAIQTTFSWTPNYCQSTPSYQFSSNHYVNSLLAYTQTHTAAVANVNRAPTITSPSFPTTPVYVPVGGSLNYNLQATDIDNTQCSESAYLAMGYQFSPYNFGAAAPDIVFSQTGSGVASLTLGPFTTDNIGKWDLKISANDGGTGNNNQSKNMTIIVYQPSYSPSCGGYNKRTRTWGACK
jgi:hypothetical protein